MALIEGLQTSISPDSACNIQFTSGTTGFPKAALISHFSLVNNGIDTGNVKALTFLGNFLILAISGDRLGFHLRQTKVQTNMPYFHVAGILAILNTIAHGATLVTATPHFHGEYSLRAIVDEKCDGIYATPSSKLLHILMKHS